MTGRPKKQHKKSPESRQHMLLFLDISPSLIPLIHLSFILRLTVIIGIMFSSKASNTESLVFAYFVIVGNFLVPSLSLAEYMRTYIPVKLGDY